MNSISDAAQKEAHDYSAGEDRPVGAENPSTTVTCDFSPPDTEDLGLF
jgi:hypothetical protein